MALTIDYFIPAIGAQEMLSKCTTLLRVLSGYGSGVRVIVIDNGSKIPLESPVLIRNEENLGMVKTLRQCMDHSTAEILIYAHSDFMLYERLWDLKISRRFEEDPKLGLIGAVGAEQADTNGGRSRVWCSFRDGHVHGRKPETSALQPVVLLDGCFMAFRRSAMDESGVPDLSFPFHHHYDKDFSMSIHTHGWKVAVLQMDCDHLSGQTACQPECQEFFNKHGGEQAIYNEAERRYLEKWGSILPVSV